MLKSIEIKGYRGFEHYRVDGLSRVNLLVGKNNCGKTALLEAIWLGSANGEPAILFEIARRRGEVIHFRDERKQYEPAFRPTGSFTKHFFHNHLFKVGMVFSLELDYQNDISNAVSFEIVEPIISGNAGNNRIDIGFESTIPTKHALKIHHSDGKHQDIYLNLIEIGEEFIPPYLQYDDVVPADFITPEFTRSNSLNTKWSKMVLDGRKSEVLEAIRFLNQDVLDMDFLPIDNRFSKSASDSIIVQLKTGQRVPLGTLGDGMRYLLGLAISLVEAEGGIILIDEIDTGLHYSVMGDLWRLVVETAKQRNIQVFATTHSQDCIRGLAWLCDNYPDLKKEVSLQKIHPAVENAVDIDGDGIVLAVEQSIEVR